MNSLILNNFKDILPISWARGYDQGNLMDEYFHMIENITNMDLPRNDFMKEGSGMNYQPITNLINNSVSNDVNFTNGSISRSKIIPSSQPSVQITRKLKSGSKKEWIKKAKWTEEEDNRLKELIAIKGVHSWKRISQHFDNKGPKQCFYRWSKVLKEVLISIPWSEEEDNFILSWAAEKGVSNWTNCAKHLKKNKRTPKNCKDRWYQKLSMENKVNSIIENNEQIWTPFDELLLLLTVNHIGTTWTKVVKYFSPIRNENQTKNKFYSILRKIATAQFQKANERGKINVFQLKSNELVVFIPQAIAELKALIGEEAFIQIKQQFETEIITKKNKYESKDQLMIEHKEPVTFTNTKPNLNQSNKINKCTIDEKCFGFSNINYLPGLVSNYSSCGNNQPQFKVRIFLCSTCKSQLREYIKKKIIAKVMERGGKVSNNTLNNHQIQSDPFNVANKIDNMMEMLSSLTHNLHGIK
jgi:hypothetical protein